METVHTIGRYRIDRLLGAGAMGEVYHAHDPVIDRPVAIKILRPELVAGLASEQWLQRFRREARAAGRRLHPNIIAIWDFGEDNGMPFLVMEYVEGRSLDEVIKSSGPLEPRRCVAIVTQVLNALGFAHESGIVHRDVKPSNILLLQNDDVKVADFGIARIDASEFTIVGDLLGTPAYMAPEQLAGAPVDHRTDLFAAGVILFEMLTGVKPFRGKSITEIISFMETRGPEDIRALNPAVPDALQRVITKSVAFDPTRRYSNAAEFSKAIAEAFEGPAGQRQVSEKPPSAAPASGATAPPTRPVAQAPPDAASWSPELSREIERDLASFIGPVASIALKRALGQANDLQQLYDLLARQVHNERDRSEFLAKGRLRAAAGFGRPGSSPPPMSERTAERGSAPLAGQASINAIKSDLTRFIGPIAKVLIRKELGKYETLAKFCFALSAYIPDERDRRAFLKAHGME